MSHPVELVIGAQLRAAAATQNKAHKRPRLPGAAQETEPANGYQYQETNGIYEGANL